MATNPDGPKIAIHHPNSDDQRIRFAMLGLQVCKSLNWHDVTKPFPKPIRGGSCFILKIDGKYIGVTANHVVDIFAEMKCENPHLIANVMHVEIDLEALIISRSARRDVATFSIPETLIDEGLKPGILHYSEWPPQPPAKDDPTIFVGFRLGVKLGTIASTGRRPFPPVKGSTMAGGVIARRPVN